MNLTRRLTVSNNEFEVTDERVVLELSYSGRAQFTVQTKAENVLLFSAVSFDIGYVSDSDLQRLFLGYVEQVTPIDNQHCKLFCRELCAALQVPVPLCLRHPTLREVLSAIRDKIKLDFSVPNTTYADFKIPHFAHVGSGYQALDALAGVFNIDDFIWQQQGGGTVFVGAWADSRWAGKSADIDQRYFNEQFSSGAAKFAAIPALRPGVELNGNRIKTLEFAGNFMTIGWQ